jgi:hypothetical protein
VADGNLLGTETTKSAPGRHPWPALLRRVPDHVRAALTSAAGTQRPPGDPMPPRPTQRPDVQLIVTECTLSLKAPRSSVTRTVKVNVPTVVGVPEMVFACGRARRTSGNLPKSS